MVKHALVVLQTKRMLALWTVILLLVPAALLGKLYEPFIFPWSISNQIYPKHYFFTTLDLTINYAMRIVIVKGQNSMN